MAKKKEHKRTGKEIAVIAVSVIMVVSILLPSFSQIFATPSSSTSTAPQSFDQAAEVYQPKIDEAKAKVEKNKDDKDAVLALAGAYYEWGIYAVSYADSDAQEVEAKELLTNAADNYGAYVTLCGSLDSDQAKDAQVNQALSYYYAGDKTKGEKELSSLAEETNYAPAWANLGMMYESEGKSDEAAKAFEKGAASDPDNKLGVKSYCEGRLESLRAQAQQSSGGASGLSSKLDGTSK